jgi:hypothetical protein
MRYDFNFLLSYCKENKIILTKKYTENEVNSKTFIKGKYV